MFERFLTHFEVSSGLHVVSGAASTPAEWIAVAGGRSFDGGLYRVHTVESAHDADGFIAAAFPEHEGRFASFGFDWLGRQFATDEARGTSSDPEVLMFEPGTGEALEIPVPFSAFHDEELVEYSDAALARTFFAQWSRAGGRAPAFAECVGYVKPLFLGGQDAVDNLELSDLGVYWSIVGQLRVQVRAFPAGTQIQGVQIEKL